MRLSDHLSKAAWSFADRATFLAYGFVGIAQLAVLPLPEYGVFYFFDTVYNILFTLSDGFVLQALVKFGVVKKQEREVLAATFVAHTFFVGTIALTAMLLRGWLAHGFHEPRYIDLLTSLPLLCLLTVPRTYALKLFQMLIRTRDIFFINLAFFGTMTVMTVYRISTGTLHVAEDMIAINISGAIAGSAMGIILAAPHVRMQWRTNISLWKEMLPFGFFQGTAVASAVVQQYIGELMVQYYLGTEDMAVYGAAKRFFKVFDAARDAIGTIAYPATARLYAQERFAELKLFVEKMMSFAFMLLAPVVLLCWLGGSAIAFHFFFHTKYDASIPVFNMLALYGVLLPFTLNLTVLTGLGKSRTILQVVVISSVVSLLGNYFLVPWLHTIGAALAVVIASAVTGTLATRAVQAEVPFSVRTLLRGFSDGWYFVKKKLWGE